MRLSTKLISVLFCIVITLYMVIFKFQCGYYPIPIVVKLVFYSFWQESETLDSHFNINEKGYSINYQLKNSVNLTHCISLLFNHQTIPESHNYTGKLRILIERDHQRVYETIIDKNTKMLPIDSSSRNTIGGFRVAKIPFPLAAGPYTNICIKIIVEEIDPILKTYIDNVQVVIFPEGIDM